MEIIQRDLHEKYPKTFDVKMSEDESNKGRTWLRKEIRIWCDHIAGDIYQGFNWKVKSLRMLYQRPHMEVTFNNGKKKLFILYTVVTGEVSKMIPSEILAEQV